MFYFTPTTANKALGRFQNKSFGTFLLKTDAKKQILYQFEPFEQIFDFLSSSIKKKNKPGHFFVSLKAYSNLFKHGSKHDIFDICYKFAKVPR